MRPLQGANGTIMKKKTPPNLNFLLLLFVIALTIMVSVLIALVVCRNTGAGSGERAFAAAIWQFPKGHFRQYFHRGPGWKAPGPSYRYCYAEGWQGARPATAPCPQARLIWLC